MIPLWLFIPVAFLAVVGCFGWLRAIVRAQETVDRILDEELSRPRLNDQARFDADDRGPANPGGGGHG